MNINRIMMLISLMLFSSWIVRLDYKIFDKKLRKYVVGMGGLLIFWMIIRMTKIFNDANIFWYLYYVAMIFVPTLYYSCSKYYNFDAIFYWN